MRYEPMLVLKSINGTFHLGYLKGKINCLNVFRYLKRAITRYSYLFDFYDIMVLSKAIFNLATV